MTPADVASTLEVLKVLARLELALARFYAACAHAYPEDRELWEGLEDDEQLHAAHLGRMAQILSDRPADLERNRSFSVVAVRTSIGYADSATQRVRSLPKPRAEYPQILRPSRPDRRPRGRPGWEEVGYQAGPCRPIMRVTGMFPAICLGLLLLLHHPVAFAGTLGEVLRSLSIPASGLAASQLHARISGPAIFEDPHTFLNLSDPRRLEYREILRSASPRRLGDLPLQRLLEVEHLRILFSR